MKKNQRKKRTKSANRPTIQHDAIEVQPVIQDRIQIRRQRSLQKRLSASPASMEHNGTTEYSEKINRLMQSQRLEPTLEKQKRLIKLIVRQEKQLSQKSLGVNKRAIGSRSQSDTPKSLSSDRQTRRMKNPHKKQHFTKPQRESQLSNSITNEFLSD